MKWTDDFQAFPDIDGKPVFPDINGEPFSFEKLFEDYLEEPPEAEKRQVGNVEREERNGKIL